MLTVLDDEESIFQAILAGANGYLLKDENGNIVHKEEDGYVPKTLSPKENGYGDYIIMDIDSEGKINNWKFDIDDFIDND